MHLIAEHISDYEERSSIAEQFARDIREAMAREVTNRPIGQGER